MAAPRRKTALRDDQPEPHVTPNVTEITATLVDPFTIQYGDFTYKRAIDLTPGSFLRCTSSASDYAYEGEIVLVIDKDTARIVISKNGNTDSHLDPDDIKEEPQYWEPLSDEDALAAMRKGNS